MMKIIIIVIVILLVMAKAGFFEIISGMLETKNSLNKINQLSSYKKIKMNMNEDEVIQIMGNPLSINYLKDGRKRLTYEHSENGYSYSRNNFKKYHSPKKMKVEIYINNDKVNEIKTLNI